MTHAQPRAELDRGRPAIQSLRHRASPRRLTERMDDPDCDRALLADALDALAAANRFFGGQRAVGERVEEILAGTEPGPLRVLDVGAGGGDVSGRLGRALRRRGRVPRFVLADVHAGVLELCRERTRAIGGDTARHTTYVRLDGARLPFEDDAFDIALSSATLHHLDDSGAARLLSELDRVSRLGWVVTDLRRSGATLLAVRLLASTLWRARPYARADGPVSVRRSFTVPEVRRLLAEVGLESTAVRARPVRWIASRHHPSAGAART